MNSYLICDHKLVQHLAKGAKLGIISTNIIGILICTYILYGIVPDKYILYWISVSILITLVRLYTTKVFLRFNSSSYDIQYVRVSMVLLFLNALLYGWITYIAIFYNVPMTNIFLISLLIITLIAGSVSTLSAVLPVFLLHSYAMLGFFILNLFSFESELSNVVILLIFIFSIFFIISGYNNNSFLKSYILLEQEQNKGKQELEELNSTLKQRVEIEVEKNRQKDHQILEQSRLAQMGEMISMIAHQWRQPLNSISAVSTNIILKSEVGILDNATAIKLASNISNYTQHLSTTIDDFRNFFKETKVLDNISYEQLINSVLNIIEDSIVNKNIKIVKELQDSTVYRTYSNEVKHVILNILKNAEDALQEVTLSNVLLDKDIQNKQITIKSMNGVLTISDNGGGIPEEIIDKIFDPYFSTKSKNGTGLGLYMSKVIIDDHCRGSLTVSNDKDGAVFKIELADLKG